MEKKFFLVGLSLLMICAIFSFACAEEIMPYADSVFDTTTASLSTRKDVSFSFVTKTTQSSIKVTSCWLQKKDGNTWKYVCSLEAPSEEATNTIVYGAVKDYSASIGTGTYRIGFVAKAGDHAITRYSNERTF